MHTYAQKMADFRAVIANRAAIGNQVQAPTLPAAADTGTPRYPQRQRSKPSKKAQSSPITCQPETRTQSPERAPDDGAWVEVTGGVHCGAKGYLDSSTAHFATIVSEGKLIKAGLRNVCERVHHRGER